MRTLLVLVCLTPLAACDPTIKTFDVAPAHLTCPGEVTVTWAGGANGGRLQTDNAVSPALPATVLKQGSLVEHVDRTTTFTFFYPSAAHREKMVDVQNTSCQSSCGAHVLTFTGTCNTGGPSYIAVTVNAAGAPGSLTAITSDADFPLHVQHAGADIALGAGGGLIGPLPSVPAAGAYSISVPGQTGIDVCGGAGPTRGGGPAPVVHLTVTPSCSN